MESGYGIQSIPRGIIDPSRSITWTGGGRPDDFGQEILAERGGTKRLPASRRTGIRGAGAPDSAGLRCPEASFTKELHLSGGSEEQPMDLSLKAFSRSFTYL